MYPQHEDAVGSEWKRCPTLGHLLRIAFDKMFLWSKPGPPPIQNELPFFFLKAISKKEELGHLLMNPLLH